MANATKIENMERLESELPSLPRWARALANGVDQALTSLSAQFSTDISDAASDVWQAAARKTGDFAWWRLLATPLIAKYVPKMQLNR
jgi:hypothetical protein